MQSLGKPALSVGLSLLRDFLQGISAQSQRKYQFIRRNVLRPAHFLNRNCKIVTRADTRAATDSQIWKVIPLGMGLHPQAADQRAHDQDNGYDSKCFYQVSSLFCVV